VVWLGVLSGTNLAGPSRRRSPNPRPFKSLQPLCRSQKSQLLWNQANPASFAKTPGVGVPPQKPPRRISNLQPLVSGPSYDSVTKPVLRALRAGAGPDPVGVAIGISRPLFLATRHSPLATFRPPGDSNMTESSHLPDNRLCGLGQPLGSSCEVLSNALRLRGGTP